MLTPGAPGRTVDARPPGALSSTTAATHRTLRDYSHSPRRERPNGGKPKRRKTKSRATSRDPRCRQRLRMRLFPCPLGHLFGHLFGHRKGEKGGNEPTVDPLPTRICAGGGRGGRPAPGRPALCDGDGPMADSESDHPDHYCTRAPGAQQAGAGPPGAL